MSALAKRRVGDLADGYEISEVDLVAACVGGDQKAWNVLVQRYSPIVWAVARSHRLSQADCEDVYQLTWMRVVQHLPKLHTPDRLSSWITTVARREALKQLPRTAKYLPVDSAEFQEKPADIGENAPEEHALRTNELREVAQAFRGLPSRDQALLSLLATDPPLSYDAVSERLGIARGSVGPLRGRALRRLEQLLVRADDDAIGVVLPLSAEQPRTPRPPTQRTARHR